MIYSEYVYVKTCSHYTKDVRSFGEIRTDVFDVMILYRIVSMSNHSIFRHDDFIGCFSADKIKKSVRKYFCFNIPIYKNMAEETSCRSPYHEGYIQTSASGNPEDLCH